MTSRSALLTAIENLTSASGTQDDVFVYVSGHGTRVFDTFNPSEATDGDRERRDNTILTSDNGVILDGELAALLADDNAKRVIVVLDISFPSGFIRDFKREFSVDGAPELLLIASAKGEAVETGLLENGVFTYWYWNSAAISALPQPGPAFADDDDDGLLNADDRDQNRHANEDGDVTLEEAFDFVSHVKAPFGLTQKPNILDMTTNDVLPQYHP